MERKNPSADLTEADRRLANVVQFGRVAAADYGRARVRVSLGPLTTGWVPFIASRAGGDRSWHPPEVGEQVVLVAPGGDLNLAVVVGALYQGVHPAPGDRATLHTVVYQDGASFTYDREAHKWTVVVPGDVDVQAQGNITLHCDGDMTLQAAGTLRLLGARIDLN